MKIKNFYPLILSFGIILLDQITKILVINHIPLNTIKYSFFSDFLQIIHVRNNAVAFSLGSNFVFPIKIIFFIIIPILLMALLIYLLLSKRGEKEFSNYQLWILAAIIGGGIGNLIDRIFRSLNVVDFVSVKMYGFFGLERFPTFNVADSAVVVAIILLLISMIISEVKK